MTPASVAIEYGDTSYGIVPHRGCAVVVASGEIDVYSAAGLREALDCAAMFSDQLILDMTELRFIGSTGLSVLLGADRHGRQRSISLVHPPRIMRKLLQLTGVGDIVTVYASREQAVDALGDEP
jgi:anti-sigma B factor antagonist